MMHTKLHKILNEGLVPLSIILFLIGILIISPQHASAQSSDKQARAFYFVAEDAYENKRYDEAYRALKRAEALRGKTDGRFLGLEIKILYAQKKDQQAQRLIERFYDYEAPQDILRDVAKIQLEIEERIEKKKKAEARRIAAKRRADEERRQREAERKRREDERKQKEAERKRKQQEELKRQHEAALKRLQEADMAEATAVRRSGNNPIGVILSDADGKIKVLHAFNGDAANKSGMKSRDHILEVNGQKISSIEDFWAQLRKKDKARIKVRRLNSKRNGYKTKTIRINIKKAQKKIAAEKARLGVKFYTVRGYRVIINYVNPNSIASAAGIQPGDYIDTIDGTPISSNAQLLSLIRAVPSGGTSIYSIDRFGEKIDISVTF
ncbi:PDZ domain-containing protein [Kordiimonas sp. SCSIO 12610]|uniref:PDZ domain-containing protein n=1 Tax=Kordiimonas sp. SCSIO 12610 TaxID=2829597 RepID=UPI00210B3E87|nr:PDZ domain-containing protein [Kordiimonas sp. SCSIO 12610]UTW54386.1 PDZ domain-containing protein [Kordiimonas sp. SCSIO 12610]